MDGSDPLRRRGGACYNSAPARPNQGLKQGERSRPPPKARIAPQAHWQARNLSQASTIEKSRRAHEKAFVVHTPSLVVVRVLFEHTLPDATQADYVLCDRQGRPMAVIEAKRASIDPIAAQDQARHYAGQIGVPFGFLSSGEEVRFLDRETDAHARKIAGFYAQDDLERRIAARRIRRDLSRVAINRKIVDRDYQIECIVALSGEVLLGRRKLLVEMATGTGRPAPRRPDRAGAAGRGLVHRPSPGLTLSRGAARPRF